jgi:precorrin-6Y C5,15-methyltransferase (decarboxylating)
MDAEDYGLMVENARLFNCPSLIPIHGKAPDAWRELPAPHAIFVGGTGRMVEELCVEASKRLIPGGRIVVNVASLDSVVDVRRALEQAGFQVEVKMIQVSRGLDWLGIVRLESGNPSFLLTGSR